jgi:hypothetical protein
MLYSTISRVSSAPSINWLPFREDGVEELVRPSPVILTAPVYGRELSVTFTIYCGRPLILGYAGDLALLDIPRIVRTICAV